MLQWFNGLCSMRAAVLPLASLNSWAQYQRVLRRGPFHTHAAGAASASVAVGGVNRGLANSSLYILDLLPLVYRYLPGDAPAPAAAAAAAAPAAPAPAPAAAAAAPEPPSAVPSRVDPAEGVVNMMLGLMRRESSKPTHMAIVVDVPGATFRHRLYPQYKAHRHDHPPALTTAISRILAVADALGVAVLVVPGVEADDVVGSLAVRGAADGFGSVVIMSTDKDYYQLLSPSVCVWSGGAWGEAYTLDRFTAEQQLPHPGLWVDVKALAGDVSDNIPGLRGVGPKTAVALVQAFGPVEAVLEAVGRCNDEELKTVHGLKLTTNQRAMLRCDDGRVAASFMKKLVTINTHLKAPPLQQPWEVFRLKVPPDGGGRARQVAQKLRMDTLYNRLPDYFQRLQDQLDLE